jgi:microcystin-dependent protein
VTGSSTTTLVFAPYGVGDGSTTFGIPNRAYLAVGRDNASGSASNINQVSTTLTVVNGSNNGVVGSAAGLVAGMYISHPVYPSGTKIVHISGTTLQFSNNPTNVTSGTSARFSLLLDAQTVGAVGGEISHINTVAETPSLSFSGTTGSENANHVHSNGAGTNVKAGVAAGSSFLAVQDVPIGNTGIESSTHQHDFSGTTNGGGAGHANVQPTIVMNYIIKR